MIQTIINLSIAELIVSREPIVVNTVLGSCVSVCLFSDKHKGGGMIHYALPHLPPHSSENALKYGDYAIERLISETCQYLNAKSHELKAKIVGGANNIASEHPTQHVGDENTKIARKILADHHIPIVGAHLGGGKGRKVLFHIQTGRLQVAFVGPGYARPSAARAIGEN